MALPRLVLTGASGFLGRQLLEALAERYVIYGLARRSQSRCGAPFHPNISWHQVDIADATTLQRVFARIREEGGAELVIHLAAHYDFTGENHPEYRRTNIFGLRNVLEECRELGIRRFVFSSSLAACAFPARGAALDEQSPPDGDHVYAHSKAEGERMLDRFRDCFPSTIIRFAAMFSDWCEYPPLFMFLETWLSRAWNRNILGGHGRSAIPYLHVHDAVRFMEALLQRVDALEHGRVVVASTAGAVSHEELFRAATTYQFGHQPRPLYVPRRLVLPGIQARCAAGRLLGELPFERPWMARYVDQALTVDPSRSCELLDWHPRERLAVTRRLPFLLENRKAYPADWLQRNRAAMKQVQMRPNLKICAVLDKHQEEIAAAFTASLTQGQAGGRFPSYQQVDQDEHRWNHRLILRHLTNSMRTRERSVFLSYCTDLAERRFRQGFGCDELCGALRELERICIEVVSADADAVDVLAFVPDNVSMTVRFGIDQIQETYELLEAHQRWRIPRGGHAA